MIGQEIEQITIVPIKPVDRLIMSIKQPKGPVQLFLINCIFVRSVLEQGVAPPVCFPISFLGKVLFIRKILF